MHDYFDVDFMCCDLHIAWLLISSYICFLKYCHNNNFLENVEVQSAHEGFRELAVKMFCGIYMHLLVVLLQSKDFHHLFLYNKGIDVLGESKFCRGKLAKAYETAAVFF